MLVKPVVPEKAVSEVACQILLPPIFLCAQLQTGSQTDNRETDRQTVNRQQHNQ